MNSSSRRITASLLLLVLLCALPLPSTHAQPPEAPPRYRVALLLPSSGPLKKLANQLEQAATLAAEETGLEVRRFDSGEEDADALAAFEAAAADPMVIAAIGPLGPAASQRLATASRHTTLPTFSLSSDLALDGLSPWLFRVRIAPETYARAMAREAYTTQGVRRVAILAPSHDYGQRASLAFADTFTSLGGTLAAVVPYDPDTKDLRRPLGALVGREYFVGARKKVKGKSSGKEGYIKVSSRKGDVDFEALFIPDFHPTIARLLPLLPTAGMQSGAGEGSGVAVQLLGMPSWHGASMRVTEAHAAGAIYHDPFGGEASGGRSEEFAYMFEAQFGRRAVDVEAELFDVVTLLGWLSRKSAPAARAISGDPVAARRLALVRALPEPRAPWRGVCGDWAYGERGALERELVLFEFDVDGEVTPK